MYINSQYQSDKNDYDKGLQVLEREIQKIQLSDYVKLQYTQNYTFENQNYKEKRNITAQFNINDKNAFVNLSNIEKNIHQSQTESLQKFNFNINFQSSSIFPNLYQLQKLNQDCQYSDLTHQKGQIYVIIYWATWNQTSLDIMKQYQNLFNQYEKTWQGLVKMYGINLDDKVQDARLILEKFQIKSMEEQYNVNKQQITNPAIRLLQNQCIPKVIIVNQDGFVDYFGRPQQIMLEKEIDKLINQGSKLVQVNNEQIPYLKQEKDAQLTLNEQSIQVQKNLLSEQQFKQALLYFQSSDGINLLKELKDFSIRIIFEEKTIINQNKVTHEYSLGKIKYVIEKQQQNNLQIFLKQIYCHIPSTSFWDRGKILDPKFDFLKCINAISDVFQKYNLENIKLAHTIELEACYDQGRFSINKQHYISQQNKLKLKDVDISLLGKIGNEMVQKGEQLYQSKITCDNVIQFIYSGLKFDLIGEYFQQIDNLYKFGDIQNQIKNSLFHKNNEILIIIIWAYWKKECIEQIDFFNCFVENNFEKIKQSNIRFAALCVEEECPEIKIIMQKYQWKNIEFYHSYDDITKRNQYLSLAIQKTPHIIIVNKNGYICHNGYLQTQEFEKKMNQTQQEIHNVVIDNYNNIMSTEYKDSQNKLEKEFQNMKKLLNSNDFQQISQVFITLDYQPEIKLIQKKIKILNYKAECEKTTYTQPQIIIKIREKDQVLLNALFELIYKNVNKEQIELQLEYLKTINIPLGNQCNVCKIKFLNPITTPHYWCKFTNQHYCIQCADKQNDQSIGIDKYQVKNNLTLINIKNQADLHLLTCIDEFKFGQNLQPNQDNIEISNQHECQCNVCNQIIVGERFICLNCNPGPLRVEEGFFDICRKCQENLNNLSADNSSQVQKLIENSQHKPNHLLQRILFNMGSYFNY